MRRLSLSTGFFVAMLLRMTYHNYLLPCQIRVDGRCCGLTGSHGKDNGCRTCYGVTAGIYMFTGGKSCCLIRHDTAPFLGLKALGGGLDQRVRRGSDGHDHAVAGNRDERAFHRYRLPTAGLIRIGQLHYLTADSLHPAVLTLDFNRIVQECELDALFLCMLHFLQRAASIATFPPPTTTVLSGYLIGVRESSL